MNRNHERARLSDFLYYTAGISLGNDKIDKLIDAGLTIPEFYGIKPGTIGYATVHPDGRSEGHRSRVLWAGEPNDLECYYVSLDQSVHGTALAAWVKDFIPDPPLLTSQIVDNIARQVSHKGWNVSDIIESFEPYTTKESK